MRTDYIDRHLPKASDIDYTDIDEVCAYQQLLCRSYEHAGGFSYPPATNSATRDVLRQGIRWLGEVKKLIDGILTADPGGEGYTLSAIPELLAGYDLMFRICHGHPCHDYIRDVKVRTAGKWVRGDRSISETDVALLLLSEVDRDIRSLDDRYSRFAISVMGGWIDQLTKYGEFRDATLSEAYRRLSYLLDANLSAYLGSSEQAAIKARWARRYTLTDREIAALDPATLRAYRRFNKRITN